LNIVIEYRSLRYLINWMIAIMMAVALSACHYRKGITMEEAWNELLDSMVPKTNRSQTAKTARLPVPEKQEQPRAWQTEPLQRAGSEPGAVDTAWHISGTTTEQPLRSPAWPLRPDSDLVGELYVVTATT